ncbi:unnamed protein product, partial [Iphiclides podalirius]
MFYLISLFLLCNHFGAALVGKDSDNFGPYNIAWEHHETCKGPKSVDLTKYSTHLVVADNAFHNEINITFLDQTVIEEIKMSVYAIKDKRKSLLWNYIVVKPCQHFALAAVLETYVGAKNCVVKKGSYYCDLNITEITYKYLGTSFFYGKFIFRVLVLSKKGNIICLVFSPEIKKKVV